MRILITGGCGFIGSHVAEAYLDEGYEVFVIDNLSVGKMEYLPDKANFEEMDIRSPDVERFMRKVKPDIVSHHAANVSLRKATKEPINDAKINITGTLNVLQSCVKSSVRRIIFASSATVYGVHDSFPISEQHMALPISYHGVGKLACEHYLYAFKKLGKTNYISLRYSNVYGPRQNIFCESGVVAAFLNILINKKSNGKIFINGDGTQVRDFVYIADVVTANVLAIKHGGGIINIGTSIETTINDLLDKIIDVTGSKPAEVTSLPFARGEQKKVTLNPKRAFFSLGWTPRISLKEGLKEYYEFIKGNDDDKTNGNSSDGNVSAATIIEKSSSVGAKSDIPKLGTDGGE
ncbi:hypothetical protein LCGC14_1140360 [marine sediment metagenome]|uniref:NAD-dependent epimerase/dehydratase domain-containing protein n=1 Tax=marine sediment metagenome TaxID=412755 RepID=A0A0F9MLJ0_9ZZZZ